jgi:hypothetical protein
MHEISLWNVLTSELLTHCTRVYTFNALRVSPETGNVPQLNCLNIPEQITFKNAFGVITTDKRKQTAQTNK